MPDLPEPMRLNRYLALCGLGSRRNVESFVAQGRVKVNGVVSEHPGALVSAGDRVTLDGLEVAPQHFIYLVINKPRGFVSAVSDARDRTVLDLLPESVRERAPFPVGRLDKASEGLLLLTNDGEFAQSIVHPRYGVAKTYEVRLDRPIAPADLVAWSDGVELEGEKHVPLKVESMDDPRFVRIVLQEGIKREIRLMALALGYEVRRLLRRAIGCLELKNLQTGKFVELPREKIALMISRGGIV